MRLGCVENVNLRTTLYCGSILRGLYKCAITISPLDLSIQSREHLLLLQSDNQVISANTTDVGNKIMILSYSGLEAMFSISASENNVNA